MHTPIFTLAKIFELNLTYYHKHPKNWPLKSVDTPATLKSLMDPIPISSAKLDANRANAQHSTGPRTEAGKAHSATNSRTHGLCSDDLLIPGEDPEELEQLKQQYLFQIEPSTPIERTLCSELIGDAWKFRRIQRLENLAYAKAGVFDAILEDD